jgi:DNA polymerase-3 subunit delta'
MRRHPLNFAAICLSGGLSLTYHRLDDIVGQEHIIGHLKDILTKDIPGHAYIFSGPGGIGKKTLALAFAAALLCPSGLKGDSCGRCTACRMFENLSTPDFYLLNGGDAGIGIDMIRELKRDIIKRPLYGKRKVYAICDADNMSAQAQNGLLKTLEEPPSFAVMILTVTNYESLLETVRSRAARFDLRRNNPAEIRKLLVNSVGVRQEDIDFIVSYSNGIIGKALKMAGTGYLKKVRGKLLEIIVSLPGAGSFSALEYYSFFEENREDTHELLGVMESLYRDLLAVKSGADTMLINSDKKDTILSGADMFTAGKIVRNISIVEDTAMKLRYNTSHRMAVEAMLIKLQEED